MRALLSGSFCLLFGVYSLPAQPALPALQQNSRTAEPDHPREAAAEGAANGGSEAVAAAAVSAARRRTGYEVPAKGRLEWQPLLLQNGLFLGIKHSYRFGTQDRTRAHIRGPFFRDYVNSIRGFNGWHDGDKLLANYVGHPMQGAVHGFTYLNNHTRERYIQVDLKSRDYWQSRFKSMGWMALASAHYELGPLGEAAFGNVGLDRHTKGAVDLVITPTLGLAALVVEDLADSRFILPLERRIENRYARLVLRSLFNPTRSMANMLGFKAPWHRTTRAGISVTFNAVPRQGRP